jgi:hypothetical protein
MVGGHPHWSQKYGGLSWIANTDWSNLKFALYLLHDDSEIANISWFDDFLQIYFIFERFCEFQKLFKKTGRKNRLKEGSKGADVNEGKFVLNINVLFAL